LGQSDNQKLCLFEILSSININSVFQIGMIFNQQILPSYLIFSNLRALIDTVITLSMFMLSIMFVIVYGLCEKICTRVFVICYYIYIVILLLEIQVWAGERGVGGGVVHTNLCNSAIYNCLYRGIVDHHRLKLSFI
jgi:hypothetical protein